MDKVMVEIINQEVEKEEGDEKQPYNKEHFFRYPKIYALHKEECDGILMGKCWIQEKVDGANTQIWFRDGWIRTGSRSKEIKEGFNGFIDYVQSHEGLKKFFADFPDLRLYGEWLVRHTIQYTETSYKKWYMYDIIDANGDRFNIDEVYKIAEAYGIDTPELFGTIENPTTEQINEFVGKSKLGPVGEGVVIKNPTYTNKFGDRRYAKIVTQAFKEDNGIVFGGNNKHSDTYHEMYVVNKYMTLERVKKIMHKLQPVIEERLDLKHTPRISGTAYHDMLVEEIWSINKDGGKIDLKKLQNLCQRKAAQIYKDILSGDVSVAECVRYGKESVRT